MHRGITGAGNCSVLRLQLSNAAQRKFCPDACHFTGSQSTLDGFRNTGTTVNEDINPASMEQYHALSESVADEILEKNRLYMQ